MSKKLSSAELYDKRITAIRKQIKRFSQTSVLNAALSHIHFSDKKKDPFSGMPWIVLFLLKLAMLDCKDTGKQISGKEFNKIANSIFLIQHLACDISEGDVMLKMRAMILQQAWYQQSFLHNTATLARQMYWFTGENSFYNENFQKIYGISLYNFYSLSLFLVVTANKAEKGVYGINLHELIFYFHPRIPLLEIRNYFTLIGLRPKDLPAFFDRFRLLDEQNQQSEYFQPSPIRLRPVIIDGNRVLIPNRNLFASGISELVPELLKKELKGEFKIQFGNDLEAYVGRLLANTELAHINEKQILSLYSKNSLKNGKVTDYLVTGTTNILIECKAIEPGDIVQSSYDTETLFRHLEKSFIKAISQIQETSFLLRKTKEFKDQQFKAIIITHEDFWFASASEVAEQLKKDLLADYNKKYGYLPSQLEDIIFIPIATLESLIGLHTESKIVFEDCILECIRRLKTQEGKRFTTSHTITDIAQSEGKTPDLVMNTLTQWADRFPSVYNEGRRYWQSNPLRLLQAHEQVLQSIDRELDKTTNMNAGLPERK